MGIIEVPNNVSLHTARNTLSNLEFFPDAKTVQLILDPRWVHIEPFGMAAYAAWSDWHRRNGAKVKVGNIGSTADYAWRMGLFNFVDTTYTPARQEHEEAGRFLPIRQVCNSQDIRSVVADVSALLHLQDSPDSLAAVQYCVSELLRNVIEHSGSEGGAFICAHNYVNANPSRVSIGVADCGIGVASHLGRAHQEAMDDDKTALRLAMQPGVTGAMPGMYGTPDNAGAGLFITRSIAKGTGGYYILASGNACYRLRRTLNSEKQGELFIDPASDRHDMWELPNNWTGTLVSMEIRTDKIEDFDSYFAWIRKYVPKRDTARRKINFT